MTIAHDVIRRWRLLDSGFSPASITGLVAWYDAANLSTLWQDSARTTPAAADGDVIGSWNDRSANGYHVTQDTTANKPTLRLNVQNGKPVVRFDGVDDVLFIADQSGLDLVGPVSVFAVGFIPDGRAAGLILAKGRAIVHFNYGLGGVTTTDGILARYNNTDHTSTHTIAGAFHIFFIEQRTTQTTFILDGSVQLQTGQTNTLQQGSGPLSVGASGANPTGFESFFARDMTEILLYNRALATSELNTVGRYLGSKWGLTWTAVP